MAPHSSILAWKIPRMEEPGGLQSMGSLRVGHDWTTSLSLFTFMHWRRKWQPTPVLLPVESQGWGSPVGCRLWGHTESDITEATLQQQHMLTEERSKLSKLDFNSMWTKNFQMFKLDLEKKRNQRSNFQHPMVYRKSKRITKQTYASALLATPKSLTVWITANSGKFSGDGNTRPPNLPPKKSVCRARSSS